MITTLLASEIARINPNGKVCIVGNSGELRGSDNVPTGAIRYEKETEN
jgi:hypothetical protein